MTTVEKLLVQIFDRKNSIIEQVKQQTELYNQHLASKLLIDGITPPSWFWSHNISGSKDLNKEELIARLLRPDPQPSARCTSGYYPFYNNLVGTSDNGEFSDGLLLETLASNKDLNEQDDPMVPAVCRENNAGCTFNPVPELDVSISSPQDQTDKTYDNDLIEQDCPIVPAISENDACCAFNNVPELDFSITSPQNQTDQRILNIYNAPDQSLARIQRSKSRQKAIELRSSAKSLPKSALNHENISDDFRLPSFSTEYSNQTNETPKLAEHCGIGESCKDCAVGESDCQHTEKGVCVYTGWLTRSRSNAKVPDFGSCSIGIGCSADNCRHVSSNGAEVRTRRSMSTSDSKHGKHIGEVQKSDGPSGLCFQSCGGWILDGADSQGTDMENNVCNGEIARSKSSGISRSCAGNSSEADSSSDNIQRKDNTMVEYVENLPVDYADGPLARVNQADVLDEGFSTRESLAEDCKSQKEMGAIAGYGEGCGTPVSTAEDCKSQNEMGAIDGYGTITKSCSSSQDNVFVDKTLDPNIPSHSKESDCRIFPISSGRAALWANAPNQELGLVTPSLVSVDLGTRSKSQAHEQEISNPLHHSETPCSGMMLSSGLKRKTSSDECLNASGGHIISPYETHCKVNERGDAGLVLGSELVLCDLDDPSDSTSSTDAKRRKEMESIVAFPSSNSSAFAEQAQLGFDVLDKYNMVYPTSSSGKERPDNSSKRMACSLDPSAPVDKATSGATRQVSIAEELSVKSDVLIKGKEIWTDLLDLNIQEKLQTVTEKHASTGSGYNNSMSYQDNTKGCLNCEYSEVRDEVGNVPSEMDATPDLHIPVELHLEPGHDSFIEQQSEGGNWNAEEQDMNTLVWSAPGSKNCRLSCSLDFVKKASADSHDCLIGNWERTDPTDIVHEKINQIQPEESQVLPYLEGEVSDQHAYLPLDANGLIRTSIDGSPRAEDFSLEKRFRPPGIESWPKLKRRKIEHQQTKDCTTSPNFRMRKLHSSQINLASRCLTNIEMDAENALIDAFEVMKGVDMEMNQQIILDLREGHEFTVKSQNEEVPFSCKEPNEHGSSSTIVSNEQLVIAPVSSQTNKEARKSGHLGMSTPCLSNDHLNASDSDNKRCSVHSSFLDKDTYVRNYENLTLTDRMLQGTKCSQLEEGQKSQCSMLSPSNNGLEFISVDQSMPVFEGFTVDAQIDSGDMDFAADDIDFDKLNLPRPTTERASILVKICRSASMDTPLSDLSSSLEFQGTQDIFQSVPNGLLESLDLKSTSSLNADDKQIGNFNSLVNDIKYSFEGMPSSDCLPYSGARYGWNLRNGYASPVGKLWERLSYHTGSSEKSLNSNPELTCFRIEEDPCISEDNNSTEEIDSTSANNHKKRHPLMEMTNLSLVPPASDSVQDDVLRVGSADFVITKPSVNATQNKVQQSIKKQTLSLGNTEVRKNQTSAIGANRIRKAKESINSSVRKPALRSKSSLRTQERTLSLKESRRNNIVSNVHSFLPLVQQQQQTASICAGKRDVKVKALEAAEAVKRLEERKENERKIRKEALKIERAKLEERNLRQLEFEKKKKEEERKKNDANVIAKKRLREEEDRKEKEKKRMRLDARQRQKEQEEKMRAEKAEKEKHRFKEEKMNKKEFNESKRQQNRDIVKGVGSASEREETKFIPNAVAMKHKESSISGYSLKAGKATQTVDNSPTNEELIVQKILENSYEISPYQCSDDENDEDEELRTRKYIPSWARKSSVALFLLSQQEMDPDTIFPPQRSCSMDEVLLPRKLHQK